MDVPTQLELCLHDQLLPAWPACLPPGTHVQGCLQFSYHGRINAVCHIICTITGLARHVCTYNIQINPRIYPIFRDIPWLVH